LVTLPALAALIALASIAALAALIALASIAALAALIALASIAALAALRGLGAVDLATERHEVAGGVVQPSAERQHLEVERVPLGEYKGTVPLRSGTALECLGLGGRGRQTRSARRAENDISNGAGEIPLFDLHSDLHKGILATAMGRDVCGIAQTPSLDATGITTSFLPSVSGTFSRRRRAGIPGGGLVCAGPGQVGGRPRG
jgi:hypothetical protein